MGVGRGIELPCLLKSRLCRLLVVTLIWLTSLENSFSPSILFTTIAPSPKSQPVLHHWWGTSMTNILTALPSNTTKLPPPSLPSCLTRLSAFPLSLPLNGLCVPLILRRVWGGDPSPQFLWMVSFWMFILCDQLLYIPNVLIRHPVETATGGTEIFHIFTNTIVHLKMWRKTGLRSNATCIGQMKSITAKLSCALYAVMDFCVLFY